MLKNLLILLIAIAFTACNNNPEYTINIKMETLADTAMDLRQSVEGKTVILDSVVLDASGNGVITGSVSSPEMMYLALSGQNKTIQMFIDNYSYTVTGTITEPTIEVDGGPQVDYNDYLERTTYLQEKQKGILDRFFAAQATGTSQDSLNMILEEYYAMMDEKKVFDSIYMSENPASVVSVFLLRGTYYQLDAEALERSLNAFDEPARNNIYYTHMSEHLDRLKNVVVGKKYIDLELPDPDGNMVKLSDIAGKGVLLIDFWAAWCNPCRRANPGVVEIYNEFSDKGFDIVGVSLDRTKEDWLKAIEDDGLTWHHMSDLQYWQSEAAKKYAVSSIPHTVLLDADGTIIAKNLSKEELREKLTELLGS